LWCNPDVCVYLGSWTKLVQGRWLHSIWTEIRERHCRRVLASTVAAEQLWTS